MKEIVLRNTDRKALVDDEDYYWLGPVNIEWNLTKTGVVKNNNVYMHNEVAKRMGLSGKIIHKDGDRLNNQSSNLAEMTVRDTGLVSLNQGLLTAIELFTTGPDPKQDSMIQICILPLNADYKPHKGILPFYVDMIPKRPTTIDWDNLPRFLTRERIYDITSRGIDAYVLADRFEMWFEKIQLKHNKKLFPLCHDWIEKKKFLVDWLCPTAYKAAFDERYRDPVPSALFQNDRAEFRNDQIPYPKQNLAYLASQLLVEHERSLKDSLQNCMVLAEIYRKMVAHR